MKKRVSRGKFKRTKITKKRMSLASIKRYKNPKERKKASKSTKLSWPQRRQKYKYKYIGESMSDRARRKRYGLSPEDFAKLKLEYPVCPICLGELREGRGGLAVDHNHETDAVRGLLCFKCNAFLGYYEKYKDQAAAYLDRFCKCPINDPRTHPKELK